ncbi:MAG: OsmC family protein [Planctomycetota bacterium]|nr:OsmC family protein [Planctomycetota bacterium]
MNAEELRSLQTPIKARYRETPESAFVTLSSRGQLGSESLTCRLETGRALVEAGLHPMAGGDGTWACSGDMLLEALVACAGVTLKAVATALGIEVRGGAVIVEGDLDFRGTLGIDKTIPVGFRAIRLRFDLDSDAGEEQLVNLLKLTERYCVIYQTLRGPTELTSSISATASH